MNENFMDRNSNFEAKGSFKIIIAIICIVLIALIILLIILSRSDKPDKIFKTTIDEAKENISLFIDDVFPEMTVLEDKTTTKMDLTFNSNMDELSFLNDYKFIMTENIDYENKYINAVFSIQEKDKLINEMIMYAVNDTLYMDLGKIYDKPLNFGEYLVFNENGETNLFNNLSKDDFKYLITNYLEYFKLALIKDQFTQVDDEIKINDENIKVKANTYKIDDKTYEQMSENIKNKVIEDDKMIDILSKILGIDKEEVISNLKGENSNDFIDSAGKSEANMILSGINNYCATSAMKSQLDGSVDICADGVTIDEVSQMVNLGNTEVTKVTYKNGKVTELVVISNGITYTLQSDGSFTSNKSDDSNIAETNSEANMVLNGINNYCATSAMKSQLDGSIDICADGVTIDEVSQMVNLGNTEVTKVTYKNGKVTELVVISNGITYTLQSDGSFTSNGNEEIESNNIEITIYTKPHSNKYLGFNISENNKSIINYTIYEEIENLFIDFGEENTMIMKGEGNIVDATFATNGIDVFNINAKVIDENNMEMTFNLLNSYYAEIKLVLSNKTINENEENLDLKLSMSYGNKVNPYKIDIKATMTTYKNSDFEIIIPDDYVNIDELTEKDYSLIQENLQKVFEGTFFENFFIQNEEDYQEFEANQF